MYRHGLLYAIIFMLQTFSSSVIGDELAAWDFTSQGGESNISATSLQSGVASATSSVGAGLSAFNYLHNGLTTRNQTTKTLTDAMAEDEYISFSVAPESGKSRISVASATP